MSRNLNSDLAQNIIGLPGGGGLLFCEGKHQEMMTY